MAQGVPSDSKRSIYWAILFALVYPTLLTLAYFVWFARYPGGVQQLVYSTGKVIQFGFPIAWVMAVERRRLRWTPPGLAGILPGVLFGLVVFAATLFLYSTWLKETQVFNVAQETVRAKVAGFGLNHLWQYVLLALFYSLGHSFLEEYYWRWFVFDKLRGLTSLTGAILISSVGFMAHHVVVLAVFFGLFSFEAALFSMGVAVGGAAWAWLYQRYGSLYAVWFSHLLVDAAIFVVGYDIVAEMFRS